MSYPGPPGISKNTTHPSLPPRPPPSKISSGFKPAFSSAPPSYPATSGPEYPTSTSHSSGPRYGTAGAPGSYGAPPSTSSYSSYGQSPAVSGPQTGYRQQPTSYSSYSQPPSYQQQPTYYGGASNNNNNNNNNYSAPQIRNPFPVPGGQNADMDPEMAAQIAQWQSAYMPKDPSEAPAKGPGRPGASGAGAASQPAPAAPEAADNASGAGTDKKRTVYREGGGKKWQDDSLLEWDPAHLRLFVGNLAGEVTDESLMKAFARWKSVQKAKVIRDKRTNKSKGFGFVSFSDPDDFFQAAKEMNGKYIQSHPVIVHKAKTEIKPQSIKEDRHRGKGGKNNKKGGKHSGSGMGDQDGGYGGYEPHLGPIGGGVTKPGQKTRGGLKLLG